MMTGGQAKGLILYGHIIALIVTMKILYFIGKLHYYML
jgi:hypothetical protein